MAVAAVVTLDKAGRVVIPKDVRDAHGMRAGTKYLLVEGADGRLWLQRLDAAELARRIEQELRGVNLRPLVARIEKEMEGLAVRLYPALRQE